MIIALYIIGAAAIILSAFAGFSSGSLLGFLVSAAGGIASAIILFALAKILENQDEIKYQLLLQEEMIRRSLTPRVKKVCPKCGYKYDENDYSYCPHCGHRG